MFKPSAICLSLLGLGASFIAQALEWPNINLEVSAVSDDNLNKAQNRADISEDQFYDLRASASYFIELNLKHALVLSGSIGVEEYDEFKGLEKTTGGLGATWQFITSGGFSAPFYQISLAVENADAETDIRDGQGFRLGASLSKNFTDRISATFGLEQKNFEADGQVFDTEESRFFTNLDYTLNRKATLYTTYSYISGDIVSTASPTLVILNWAEAWEADNAFGGPAGNALAYRLDAETQVLNIGLNYAINERNSLDFSGMSVASEADAGIKYDRLLFRATYLTRF